LRSNGLENIFGIQQTLARFDDFCYFEVEICQKSLD